jgi:hypothetical protein
MCRGTGGVRWVAVACRAQVSQAFRSVYAALSDPHTPARGTRSVNPGSDSQRVSSYPGRSPRVRLTRENPQSDHRVPMTLAVLSRRQQHARAQR